MTTTLTQPKKRGRPPKSSLALVDLSRLAASCGTLRRMERAMIAIGADAPNRLTLSQVGFFINAATQDLMGRSPTFTDIVDDIGEGLSKSLHTTYKVFFAPSRTFPKGMGWLESEMNPRDNREKFIRLTPAGREVIAKVIAALEC